jgi:hypothetical protein
VGFAGCDVGRLSTVGVGGCDVGRLSTVGIGTAVRADPLFGAETIVHPTKSETQTTTSRSFDLIGVALLLFGRNAQSDHQ